MIIYFVLFSFTLFRTQIPQKCNAHLRPRHITVKNELLSYITTLMTYIKLIQKVNIRDRSGALLCTLTPISAGDMRALPSTCLSDVVAD